MSSELEPFGGPVNPIDRIPLPPWWTQAYADDRSNQHKHLVKVRQLLREAEEDVARQFAAGQRAMAEIQVTGQVRREMKLDLQRAFMESRILAGDDPEMKAMFSLFDEDDFKKYRLKKFDLGTRP